MSVYVDTNVCLRFLVGDDPEKLTSCRKFFESAEQGKIRLRISSIVLLEVYWVLLSLFKHKKHQVQDALEKIMNIRGLVIVETTDFRVAFALHKKTGVKLADCLIATQIPKGVALCTFDKEFRKIPRVSIVEPRDVVKKNAL